MQPRLSLEEKQTPSCYCKQSPSILSWTIRCDGGSAGEDEEQTALGDGPKTITGTSLFLNILSVRLTDMDEKWQKV